MSCVFIGIGIPWLHMTKGIFLGSWKITVGLSKPNNSQHSHGPFQLPVQTCRSYAEVRDELTTLHVEELPIN